MVLHYNDPMITQSELQGIATYDADAGVLRWAVSRGKMRPGDRMGSIGTGGYQRVRIDNRQYLEHRLVWLWHHGEFPRILDHIDRNQMNNRIENLRLCNESQNAANSGPPVHNTSGYRGVCWDSRKGKWKARVSLVVDGQRLRQNVGHFDTAEDAAIHYNLRMHQLFADYALLNRVDTPLGRLLGMS